MYCREPIQPLSSDQHMHSMSFAMYGMCGLLPQQSPPPCSTPHSHFGRRPSREQFLSVVILEHPPCILASLAWRRPTGFACTSGQERHTTRSK